MAALRDTAAPRVIAVEPESPAERAGLRVGDELDRIDGRAPRDVLEYRRLVDDASPAVEVRRGHETFAVVVDKRAGEPLGVEVHSAVFDRVQTCDNHCEFCFIHQLPKGMRRSLYLKDDDYRLSFLYGNFTTLTRFTEADLERVLDEALWPLHVSIHATDPEIRARMLRNRRGATSLRWLRALLDHAVPVHGQVVVCPGVNDGPVLADTLAGVLDEYPELASVGVVPLGVSRFSSEPSMRVMSPAEAACIVDEVERFQAVFVDSLGRRLVHAADELYLLAGRELPPLDNYEGVPQHENGIGMVRTFEAEVLGHSSEPVGVSNGFFAAVDGAPADGYRSARVAGEGHPVAVLSSERRSAPVTVVTGEYAAPVLRELVGRLAAPVDTDVMAVENRFFGGNIAVTGLLVGEDVAAAVASVADDRRVLLPDVCLSQGLFLDGLAVGDLPRPVEVVPTHGVALRRALTGAGR